MSQQLSCCDMCKIVTRLHNYISCKSKTYSYEILYLSSKRISETDPGSQQEGDELSNQVSNQLINSPIKESTFHSTWYCVPQGSHLSPGTIHNTQVALNPYMLNCFEERWIYILYFNIISWHLTDMHTSKFFSWKTWICQTHTVNIMPADTLALCVTRASAAMVLTSFYQNILYPAWDELNVCEITFRSIMFCNWF